MKHDCPEAELEIDIERKLQDDIDLLTNISKLRKIRVEMGYLTYGDFEKIFGLEGLEYKKYFLYCGDIQKWKDDIQNHLDKVQKTIRNIVSYKLDMPKSLNDLDKEEYMLQLALHDQKDVIEED